MRETPDALTPTFCSIALHGPNSVVTFPHLPVREMLGRERTYRQVAERERDHALERIGALEARLAVPDVADSDPAPIMPETLHAGRTGAEMESSVSPRNAAYGGGQSSPRRSWWRVILGLDGGETV